MWLWVKSDLVDGTSGVFFFQAEDGIRDKLVTGVQTCALPILSSYEDVLTGLADALSGEGRAGIVRPAAAMPESRSAAPSYERKAADQLAAAWVRSEERRVGKGCGYRGAAHPSEISGWSPTVVS